MPIARLSGRAAIDITGADATGFLQNLITADVPSVAPGTAAPSALLSPQGKILFDFLLSRHGDGFRLELRDDAAPDLLRRLTLYRLRSRVEISLVGQLVVTVAWETDSIGADWLHDLRFPLAQVWRHHGATAVEPDAGEADWHGLRIRHGVAESGSDFEPGEAFPHDVLLDRNEGISFRKGCYVGQEVVSRMQHRGTARRRILLARGAADLPGPATEISADGRTIGQLGSVAGREGLALVRIDRAAHAMRRSIPILAGDVEITLAVPDWAGFGFPADAEEGA